MVGHAKLRELRDDGVPEVVEPEARQAGGVTQGAPGRVPGVDQRPSVAADAGALLPHPHRREAAGLDALDESRRDVHNDGGTSGDGEASVDSPAPPKGSIDNHLLVALSASLTSQSRHSLTLAGSPPSAKLLIPLERRDVRVVEGARLENDSGDAHRVILKYLFSQ